MLHIDTLTAIGIEKVKMRQSISDSLHEGDGDEMTVRVKRLMNGFTVNAGFGSAEFIADSMEMAFEIAAEFLIKDSEVRKPKGTFHNTGHRKPKL